MGPDLDDTYTFTPTSNRLEIIETLQRGSTPPPPAHTNREYHYNQAGRLSEVIENGLLQARYTYDAEGQRTRKVLFSGGTLPTGTTLYHYDLTGGLIAETTEDGTALRDYLWHDDEPLAQIDTAQGFETLRYLHTDHLKTPRFATGQSGAILWRWEGEAFGSTAPELASAAINLRFPGQYFDAETGLHYNYFRDYDPTTGRYSQSDPIGLAGGINTYAYTYNNPTGYFDSNGGNPVAAAARGGYLAGQALNAAINYTLVATTGLTLGGLIYETLNGNDSVLDDTGPDPLDDDYYDDSKTCEDDKDPCKQVRRQCIEKCSTSPPLGEGGRTNQGMPFFRCVNKCLADNGCL